MEPTNQKPAAQGTIDDLRSQATSPEDHAVVDEFQAEFNTERSAAVADLGKDTVKLTQLPDGTVTTEDQVQRMHEAGEDPSHPYGNGGRRA